MYSGYRKEDRIKILEDGLTKFFQKINGKLVRKEPRYRSAEETVEKRLEAKLIEKQTW